MSQIKSAKNPSFAFSRAFLQCQNCAYLSRDLSLKQTTNPCPKCKDTSARSIYPDSSCITQLLSIRYFFLKAHSRKISLRRGLSKEVTNIIGHSVPAKTLVKLVNKLKLQFGQNRSKDDSFSLIQTELSISDDQAHKLFTPLFMYSEAMEESRAVVIFTCALFDRLFFDLVVRSYVMRGVPIEVAREITEKHVSFQVMEAAFKKNSGIGFSAAITKAGFTDFYDEWKSLTNARNRFLHRAVSSSLLENRELAFKLALQALDVFGRVSNNHLLAK